MIVVLAHGPSNPADLNGIRMYTKNVNVQQQLCLVVCDPLGLNNAMYARPAHMCTHDTNMCHMLKRNTSITIGTGI